MGLAQQALDHSCSSVCGLGSAGGVTGAVMGLMMRPFQGASPLGIPPPARFWPVASSAATAVMAQKEVQRCNINWQLLCKQVRCNEIGVEGRQACRWQGRAAAQVGILAPHPNTTAVRDIAASWFRPLLLATAAMPAACTGQPVRSGCRPGALAQGFQPSCR